MPKNEGIFLFFWDITDIHAFYCFSSVPWRHFEIESKFRIFCFYYIK